jgi:GTPase SAR1 family protein
MSAPTGRTEPEIRERFLAIRAKVLNETATDTEVLEATELIEWMGRFQEVRERKPKTND